MSSRTRRSVLTLLTGIGGSAMTLIVGLLATPFLLHWLGDERVGTHRVATEWLGYLVLLDFGLAGVLQTVVAKRLSENQQSLALADVRYAMWLFIRVAILQLVLLVGFGVAASELIVGLSADTLQELRWGLALASLSFFLAPLAALRPLFDGSQNSFWVNWALMVQSLGTTAASLIFAWLGYGLLGQFAATVIGSVTFYAFLVWRVNRMYPGFWRSRNHEKADSFPVAWPMFVFNLVGRISVLSDSLILGTVLGPFAVVRFAVTQRLMMVVAGQIQGIGVATWAALAELHHRRQAEQFRLRFLQINRWTAILAIAGLGPLAALNEPLVSLWVGSERYSGAALTWATLFQGALIAQVAVWAWPFAGTGRVQMLLPVMLVGSAINLIVSIASTHFFGEVGPTFGTIAGYLGVYYWWYPLLLHRQFEIPVRVVMNQLPIAVAIFLPFGVGLVSLEAILPTRWTSVRTVDFLAWGLLAAVSSALYLVCAWRLMIPVDERHALAHRIFRKR